MWNIWDEDVAKEILSPNVDFRGSIGLQRHGLDGFIEYMHIIQGTFPDFHNQIEEPVAEGDKVVARLTYTGTHRGPLFGIEAAGREIIYAGVAIFQCAEGRIKSVWVLGDTLSLLKQIGAIPQGVG